MDDSVQTQRKPIVFISYSGYEGVVKGVVDALVVALRRKGFEPEWDRGRIGLGEKIKPEVDAMMQRCDAAVVVVGTRALEHEHRWVYAEATVLTRLPGRVTVVPVYVEGQSPTTLPDTWTATGLPELASFVILRKSRRTMTKEVLKALEGARQVVLASPFERELRDYLTGTDADTLKRAAQPLAGEPPRWSAGDLSLQVAFALLEVKLTPAWSTYENIARLVDLRKAQMCARVGLPFTWVDREVARRIGDALTRGTSVALNITDESPKICEAYVHCGWPTFPTWTVYGVPDGWDGTIPALRAQVAAALQDHATANFIRPGASLGVVLAVSCPGFDPEIIRSVRAAVAGEQGLGLVFLGGDARWDNVPPQLRGEMSYERIDVDEEHEDGAWRWNVAHAALCQYRRQAVGDPSVCV